MKKYLPTLVIGLGILAVVGFVVFALNRPDTSKDMTKDESTTKLDKKDIEALKTGPALGPADAKVTLTEFGDFQCPGCGTYHPILKDQIFPQFKGKIRFVFKNFPLTNIHKNAEAAALAAQSAAAQGKFWGMHDQLFEKQTEWVNLPQPLDKFASYATSIGVNPDTLKTDVQAKKYLDKITDDQNLGTKLEITGTPSFFINGAAFDTSTGAEGLKKAIQDALNK